MQKKTVVDQIEVRPNGDVQVRFGKLLVNDDGSLCGEPQWHRAVFHPGCDIEAGMRQINNDLTSHGEATVDATCVSRLSAHAAIAWTPENLSAFAEKQRLLAIEVAKRDVEARAQMQAAAEAEAQKALEVEAQRKAEFDAAVEAKVREILSKP